MSSRVVSLGTACHQLDVSLRHRLGAVSLDLSFSLTQRWSVLFAPSGAGKTTILRAIAGLLRPDHGRIVSRIYPGSEIQSESILTDTEKGVFVPTHRRFVRMVAQEPALFPSMNVMRNMRYGMIFLARDAEEDAERDRYIAEILELCRIGHLTTKMPAELSGGERQRVALARALAAGGTILLLDEPFTGMEFELRDGLIRDLRAWLGTTLTPVLQVTHDIGEVFATEAEVLVLAEGRLIAQGPAAEVLKEQRAQMLKRLSI